MLYINISNIDANRNDQEKKQLVNKLRITEGLPERKFKERYIKNTNISVLVNADVVTITGGPKYERGFVYLNLNGGDSWGYWHPENNPEVLFNFKGEPNFSIEEVAPEYHRHALKKAREVTQDTPVTDAKTGITPLAFTRREGSAYYVGTYNHDTDELDIYPLRSRLQVIDFIKQCGQPVPDPIPVWSATYDFHTTARFNHDKKWINLYKASNYLRNASPGQTEIPPTIRKIIFHMVSNDQETFDRFINWLAYIIQFRDRTATAWVLQGTEGTGKGYFIEKILEPILGKNHVVSPDIASFAREFNAFMEHALIVYVDESEVSGVTDLASAMRKLRKFITEASISIRKMHMDEYKAPNHANFIFASNKYDAIQIPQEDRRFNVAARQTQKLWEVIPWEILDSGIVQQELQAFTNYLVYYEVDRKLARTPMESEERELIKERTCDTFQLIAEKISRGDLEYFIENAPLNDRLAEFIELTREEELTVHYAAIIEEALASNGEPVDLPRRHIELLFFCLGAYHQRSVTKFTQFVKHKGLNIKPITYGNERHRGLHALKWKITNEALELWEARKPKKFGKPKLVKGGNDT